MAFLGNSLLCRFLPLSSFAIEQCRRVPVIKNRPVCILPSRFAVVSSSVNAVLRLLNIIYHCTVYICIRGKSNNPLANCITDLARNRPPIC